MQTEFAPFAYRSAVTYSFQNDAVYRSKGIEGVVALNCRSDSNESVTAGRLKKSVAPEHSEHTLHHKLDAIGISVGQTEWFKLPGKPGSEVDIALGTTEIPSEIAETDAAKESASHADERPFLTRPVEWERPERNESVFFSTGYRSVAKLFTSLRDA